MIRTIITASALALLIGASAIGLRAPTAHAQQTQEPDFRYGYGVVYDDIITADAANAVKQCEALRKQLSTNTSASVRHEAFVKLADAWGRVQAIYILGDFEENAVDYPLLIDTFHAGNEDIPAKLARAINSDSEPKTALFKNAYRTLTALDYLMFSDKWTERRMALSQVAAETVCSRLQTLHDDYVTQRTAYLDDPKKAMASMIDAIIQGTYKTRDWRIGQVAGLTRKTLGKTLPENAQFANNLEASWAAIGAIIDTHRRLLIKETSINITTLAIGSGRGDLPQVQMTLQDAQTAYDAATYSDYTNTVKMEPLYAALKDVQSALYDHVAGSLGVSAGLVDADGD